MMLPSSCQTRSSRVEMSLPRSSGEGFLVPEVSEVPEECVGLGADDVEDVRAHLFVGLRSGRHGADSARACDRGCNRND
jgi:hypothetical protein